MTLHPAHARRHPRAARRAEDVAELAAHGIAPIDLVCVNLYPFEQTVGRLDVAWEEAIEKIDVGGPALLRAAAKNHAHVVPLCRPEDYEPVLAELRGRRTCLRETRRVARGRAPSRRPPRTTPASRAGSAGDEAFPETFVPAFDR